MYLTYSILKIGSSLPFLSSSLWLIRLRQDLRQQKIVSLATNSGTLKSLSSRCLIETTEKRKINC